MENSMSATKWKTKGFLRPWTPRNWPIPHIDACPVGDEWVVEVKPSDTQRRYTVFGGDFSRGFDEQPLASAYDRAALID